ncbi:hypothetical protein Tco_1154024 [Tanacetum coccineum]
MPPYNNRNTFYQSSTGLYRFIMDSSTSFQENKSYSPLNRVTLDMDIEKLMPRRMIPKSRQKNGQRRKRSCCAKVGAMCLKPPPPGGFNLNNEADESDEETKEQRPMGRDQAKKKKSSASMRDLLHLLIW